MIDFTRRRFLFGLAAVPLVVPAVKHFVMPKLIEAPAPWSQHDLGDKLLAWWDMGFTGNFRDALIRIPLTGEQTREVTAWMSQGSTCCPLISAIGNEHHVVRAT